MKNVRNEKMSVGRALLRSVLYVTVCVTVFLLEVLLLYMKAAQLLPHRTALELLLTTVIATLVTDALPIMLVHWAYNKDPQNGLVQRFAGGKAAAVLIGLFTVMLLILLGGIMMQSTGINFSVWDSNGSSAAAVNLFNFIEASVPFASSLMLFAASVLYQRTKHPVEAHSDAAESET